MPDSGWVGALRDAGYKFFGGIGLAVGVLALVWRWWPAVVSEPFAGARSYAEAAAILLLAGATFQVLFIAATTPGKLPWPLASWVMRRRYRALSAQQKTFLKGLLGRGTRDFSMHGGRDRWFEELEEKEFVAYVHLPIWVSGNPTPYEVKREAWRVLEQLNKKGKL